MAVFHVYVPITEGEFYVFPAEANLPHLKEIEADIAAHWNKNVEPAIFRIQINEELDEAGYKKHIADVVMKFKTEKDGKSYVDFQFIPEKKFRWNDEIKSMVDRYVSGQITDGWGENLQNAHIRTESGEEIIYSVG